MQLHQFSDSTILNHQFAELIAVILRQAIASRGHAYLAVSGGKTPQGFFCELAKMELDWTSTTLVLTDERRVSLTHKDSNEHLIREYLLKENAATANFISLYSDKNELSACLAEIEGRLQAIPTFDAVILGMGEDGHTASLFPCSKEISTALADTEASVVAIKPITVSHQRFSLTKTRLLNSRSVFLHIVGEKKLATLNNALAAGSPFIMPIAAFLNHPATNVQVMFAL